MDRVGLFVIFIRISVCIVYFISLKFFSGLKLLLQKQILRIRTFFFFTFVGIIIMGFGGFFGRRNVFIFIRFRGSDILDIFLDGSQDRYIVVLRRQQRDSFEMSLCGFICFNFQGQYLLSFKIYVNYIFFCFRELFLKVFGFVDWGKLKYKGVVCINIRV